MNKEDKYIVPLPSCERKKNLVADHTTWCGDDIPAGVNLAKILNEIGDYEIIGQVNGIITKFDRRISSLSKIKEGINVSLKYFADLMMHDMKNDILLKRFPNLVETHLLNLITAKYRNIIHRQSKKHGRNN